MQLSCRGRLLAPYYAHALSYPVALKILDADVVHKSDIGGVILDISGGQEFESQARSLAKTGELLLVQRMLSGLADAIVGYRDDPVVRPLVMVGAGGILAELYNDVVLRLAPVSLAEANPVIVKAKGVVAVDALAAMKEEMREE